MSGRWKRLARTLAVFLLTCVLAVSAVLTYVAVPDVYEPSAKEASRAGVSGQYGTKEQGRSKEQGQPEEQGRSEEESLSEHQARTEETSGAAGRTKQDELTAALSEKQNVRVTILGDSIAKGYSGDKEVTIEPYGNLVMEELAERGGFSYEITSYAKNGLDSAGMNSKILTDEEVCGNIADSDVIFITVGSNDLLNECKSVVQEILNTDTKFKSADEALKALKESVTGNPLLVFRIIDKLENWDYQSFRANWIEMMERLGTLKKEDAWIVVTNIYNPVANLDIPETMANGVENVIWNMNEIIGEYAEKYDYQVIDVFHSEVYSHLQKDGLHPDQTGQQLIADQICGE